MAIHFLFSEIESDDRMVCLASQKIVFWSRCESDKPVGGIEMSPDWLWWRRSQHRSTRWSFCTSGAATLYKSRRVHSTHVVVSYSIKYHVCIWILVFDIQDVKVPHPNCVLWELVFNIVFFKPTYLMHWPKTDTSCSQRSHDPRVDYQNKCISQIPRVFGFVDQLLNYWKWISFSAFLLLVVPNRQQHSESMGNSLWDFHVHFDLGKLRLADRVNSERIEGYKCGCRRCPNWKSHTERSCVLLYCVQCSQ